MRIGIITDTLDNKKWAGVSTITYNVVSNLLKIDKKNKYILVHNKKSNNELYKKAEDCFVPLPKLQPRGFLWLNFVLPKLLKKKIDLIHGTSQAIPLFGKFRKVVSINDLSTIFYPQTHILPLVFMEKLFLPLILRRADLIISISNSTKKGVIDVFKINPEKIKVVHLGINHDAYYQIKDKKRIDKFRKKKKIKYQFILYVGTLEPRKNIPFLIKAFHILKKKGFKHKLLIVGKKGWKYKNIFGLIKDLNLEKDIIFTDHKTPKELVYYYNSAEMMVYPSIYEGFGLPPIEAMACGCPVILSGIDVHKEVAGSAAYIFKLDNLNNLIKAITDVASNKKLRSDLIKKGLKRSKLYDWKKTAKSILEIYKTFN